MKVLPAAPQRFGRRWKSTEKSCLEDWKTIPFLWRPGGPVTLSEAILKFRLSGIIRKKKMPHRYSNTQASLTLPFQESVMKEVQKKSSSMYRSPRTRTTAHLCISCPPCEIPSTGRLWKSTVPTCPPAAVKIRHEPFRWCVVTCKERPTHAWSASWTRMVAGRWMAVDVP